MELPDVINTQFAFHGIVVGLVLICAVLVFVFGFKSVEEFPFDKLTNTADDRKPAGKKRKVKDKKVQSNGHATAVGNDKGDSKQKTDNAAAAKGNSAKSATKDKKEVEKVPVKELNKVVAKQEKKQQVKAEPSPNKTALKETKNIKDNKKNVTDESQKQIKEKKGDASGKDIKKTKQVAKNKGKENVEVKNKKNTEKAIQKSKVDDKPKDDDEGEWEQAVYRKDKKKKAAATDDEIISDKSVKKGVSSPAKKKKSKSAENSSEKEHVTNITTSATLASVEIEQVKTDSASNKEQKQAKKELKKDKVKSSEEIVNETEVTPVDTEGDAKSGTKKKKKKSGKENAENIPLPVGKDVPHEQQVTTSAPSKPKKVEVRATVEAKPASSQPKSEVMTENTAVFDELGDVWKEAKAPKKSNKKKVRKDQ